MSLKENPIVYLLFAILLSGSVTFLSIFYWFETKNLEKIENLQYQKIQDSYRKNLIKHLQENYTTQVQIFVDEEMKTALERRDRKTLHTLSSRLFAKAQRKDPYLEILHFHLPDGTSFLRLHQSDTFGDPIAKSRHYIASVHQEHNRVYGFEEGIKHLALYRVIEPLFINNRYIGAVEIGASPQKVLDLVTQFNNIEGAITFFDAKNPVVFANISNKALLENYRNSVATRQPLADTIRQGKKHYKAYTFAITDFYGKSIGEFVFFYDFSPLYTQFIKTMTIMSVWTILLLLVMFFLLRTLVIRHEQTLHDLYRRAQMIMDSQSDIVIVTDGNEIIEVNQKFLEFVRFKSLEAFKARYRCICEWFIEGEGLIGSITENALWTHYLLMHADQENVAKISVEGEVYLFRLYAQQLSDTEIVISMQNITALKNKERELSSYLKLVDKNILISSTDLEGNITYVSQAFIRMSGYTKEELIGKTHRVIRHPDMPPHLFEELWATITENKVWHGELKSKKRDGGYFWSKMWIHPKYDENGIKIGYTGIRHDITDKKLIEEISITDALTQIYNRRYFDEMFPKIIQAAQRNNALIAFILMDIDHFKRYNDTYGHPKGDDALRQVAHAIKTSLKRGGDYCFRLGGEEFGVIFHPETIDKAAEFANTLRRTIEQMHIEHKNNSASPYVTVSMGMVCKPAHEIHTVLEMYNAADALLYEVKSQGRNNVAL